METKAPAEPLEALGFARSEARILALLAPNSNRLNAASQLTHWAHTHTGGTASRSKIVAIGQPAFGDDLDSRPKLSTNCWPAPTCRWSSP